MDNLRRGLVGNAIKEDKPILPPDDEVWIWGRTTNIGSLGYGNKVTIVSQEYDGEKLIIKLSGKGTLGESFTRYYVKDRICAIGANLTLVNAYNYNVTKPLAICYKGYGLYSNTDSSAFAFKSSSYVYVPDDLVDYYLERKKNNTWAGVKPLSQWAEVFK